MSTGPASRSDSRPGVGRGAALGLFVAFLLLGIVFTIPLVRHVDEALPFTAVPGPGRELGFSVPGDYLQFYYYLWLVRERTLTGTSFLRDPFQFAIDGPRPNLPNIFLPAALLFVPLSALGPLFAYNALVMLSFPFAGLATALLARRYGISWTGAFIAGVVFACAPYRVGALLGGHPAGVAYPLVPLLLWGLEGALAGSVWSGLVAGGAALGLAIMEPHFAYFAALGVPLYALARIGLPAWRSELLAVGPWAGLLASLVALAPAGGALAALARQNWVAPVPVRLAVGAVVALLALTVWQLLAAWLLAAGVTADPRVAARRSLAACLPWLLTVGAVSPRGGRIAVAALAAPLLVHGVWMLARWRRWWHPRLPLLPVALAAAGAIAGAGFLLLLQRLLLRRSVSGGGRTLHEVLLFSPTPADLFTRANPLAARLVYPGVVALVLAALAVVVLARQRPTGTRRLLWIFVPLLVTGVIVSLGPRLEALPLFEVAFRLVPSWNFIRQPAKAQVLAGLGLAILAGVGADALARRRGSAARAAVALTLGLLVAADSHSWRPAGISILPTGGAAFDTIRAEGPRALWIPLWPGDSALSGLYLYATTLTEISMLNGYSAWLGRSYLTDVYRPLEPVNLGVVGEAEAEVLRRYGVRQVILAQDAFPLKVSAFGPALARAYLEASPYLDPVEAPSGEWRLRVFRVRRTPRPVAPARFTSPLGIFWEAESLGRDTGRVTADADASNGRVTLARSEEDRPGFLTSGPYRLLPPGDYRARFRLKGVGSTVELQVTTQGGREVLGRARIHLADGVFVEVAVPFALAAAAPVEYRTRWDGQGWVAVDTVRGGFTAEPDPAQTFEVEILGHELQERPDPFASGGVAGHAVPDRTARDAVWSGPLRGYSPGRYQLWVRLKLDRAVAGAFARCAVELASRAGELGGRELLGADVPEAGRYVELAVPFTVSRPSVLEFPCTYRGGVGVWFDRLRVERLGD